MVNRTRVGGGGYIKHDIIHNMINRRVVTTLWTYYYRYLLYLLWYFVAWCIIRCWGISTMFTGSGVRFHTAIVLLIQSSCNCPPVCHINLWFLPMSCVLDLIISLSIFVCVSIILLIVYPVQRVCTCGSPIYCCLSGTTCIPAIVQYITTSLFLLSTGTWYTVSYLCVQVMRS